jgi:hypothetical protein
VTDQKQEQHTECATPVSASPEPVAETKEEPKIASPDPAAPAPVASESKTIPTTDAAREKERKAEISNVQGNQG